MHLRISLADDPQRHSDYDKVSKPPTFHMTLALLLSHSVMMKSNKNECEIRHGIGRLVSSLRDILAMKSHLNPNVTSIRYIKINCNATVSDYNVQDYFIL
jgi:hypothetical protein